MRSNIITTLLLATFLGISLVGYPQIDRVRLAQIADSLMTYGAQYPMIPGGVLSISSSDSIYLLGGYGFSNVKEKIKVNPKTTLFQLGSVGKLITAIGVIQNVEKGKLDPDLDVNSYLSEWQIENPYDQKISIGSLLTHSAGFDERVIGYMAPSAVDIQDLGPHLAANMPSLFQPPGKSINYSNYSYALAGHLIEIGSGLEFQQYVHENIFNPLAMNSSTYQLPDDYNSKENFALGYQWREEFNEVRSYPRHATPAGSIISTAEDMTYLMQAILKKDSALLGKNGFELLLTQQFSNHDLLTGYTLGMEVQDFNGTPAVAKGGNVPGFLSVIILFPQDDLGLFLAVNTQTDNFLELLFDSITREFFPPRMADKHEAYDLNPEDYTGVFINERANHHTIEEMFELFEGQFSIWVNGSGNLACYHNGKTQEYIPFGGDIFQNLNNDSQFIVFQRDQNGVIKEMYRNFVLGGIQIPASYRKASWFERPRFLNDEYPYLLLVIISYLLLPVGWIMIYFRRKKYPDFMIKHRVPFYSHAFAMLFLGLFIWNIAGFWIPLLKDRQSLFFGFDMSLYAMRYYNYAMAVSVLALLVTSIRLWLMQQGSILFRLYYLLFTMVAVGHIHILDRWHFLSITYR